MVACEPSTTDADFEVGSQDAVIVYVDHTRTIGILVDDNLDAYMESNGIDGLQRRDVMIDNTCGGAIEPDTWIWGTSDPNPL